MINIKSFDSNLLKIDKKSYRNIDIHYISYITMRDFNYVNIKSINPLYLIIGEEDGCIEKRSGNKYLTLVSTDKNKEVLSKYTEHWDVIKNLIEKVNNKPGKYGKDFMKIKFNLDDNLPLNKTLKASKYDNSYQTSFFKKVVSIIHKFFLDECLYEL